MKEKDTWGLGVAWEVHQKMDASNLEELLDFWPLPLIPTCVHPNPPEPEVCSRTDAWVSPRQTYRTNRRGVGDQALNRAGLWRNKSFQPIRLQDPHGRRSRHSMNVFEKLLSGWSCARLVINGWVCWLIYRLRSEKIWDWILTVCEKILPPSSIGCPLCDAEDHG